MKKVLLAGATGYLGSYIAKELHKKALVTRVIVRNTKPLAISAFDVLGSKPKLTYIPEWIRTSILKLLKLFTGSKTHGPIEFFMTVMAIDMVAPEYGKCT